MAMAHSPTRSASEFPTARREILLGAHADHGEIGLAVRPTTLPLPLACWKTDADLVRILDDVVVGENQPSLSMTTPDPRLVC